MDDMRGCFEEEGWDEEEEQMLTLKEYLSLGGEMWGEWITP